MSILKRKINKHIKFGTLGLHSACLPWKERLTNTFSSHWQIDVNKCLTLIIDKWQTRTKISKHLSEPDTDLAHSNIFEIYKMNYHIWKNQLWKIAVHFDTFNKIINTTYFINVFKFIYIPIKCIYLHYNSLFEKVVDNASCWYWN